jgi:hypothetical protein
MPNDFSQWRINSLQLYFIAYNLSSHQCNERRQLLSNELEYLVQYKEDPNAHIKQSLLMDMLNLEPKEKSLLTRTVKATFPNSTKKIIMVDRESMYPIV